MTEMIARPGINDLDFAYIMSDDSMVDARIFPGDIILVKQQDSVDEGDIALALMNEDVKIGRYSRHNDCELLTPASMAYKSVISDLKNPSFKIIARAIAFIGALSCVEEGKNIEV